jgi:predicted ATP-grasp superfamily ATP-dependent carboligase
VKIINILQKLYNLSVETKRIQKILKKFEYLNKYLIKKDEEKVDRKIKTNIIMNSLTELK